MHCRSIPFVINVVTTNVTLTNDSSQRQKLRQTAFFNPPTLFIATTDMFSTFLLHMAWHYVCLKLFRTGATLDGGFISDSGALGNLSRRTAFESTLRL